MSEETNNFHVLQERVRVAALKRIRAGQALIDSGARMLAVLAIPEISSRKNSQEG